MCADVHASALADPLERDIEFWRAMHLLREHRRVERAGPARRRGVRPRIKSNAEVKAELHRALVVFEGCARRANYRL